jgi:hypothetical protein
MAIDLDTKFITTGQMGHSTEMTLRYLILGDREAIQALMALGSASESATTAFISSASGSVTAVQLAGGFAKHALVDGAVAGNVTVTGIKSGDELNEVVLFKHGDLGVGTAITDIIDLTSEFTIPSNSTINNTSGTSSFGHKLMVRWTKKTS